MTPDFKQRLKVLLEDDVQLNIVENDVYPTVNSIHEENRNIDLVEMVTIKKEINATTLDNTEHVQDNPVQTAVRSDNKITLRECFVNLNRLTNNNEFCLNISKAHSSIRKPNHVAKSTDICNNSIKDFALYERLVKENNIKSRCIVVLNRLSPDVQKECIKKKCRISADTSRNSKCNNHSNEVTTVNKANRAILNKNHFQPRKCFVLLERSSIIETGNKYIQQSKNCMQISKKRNYHITFKRLSNNIIDLNMRISINERLYTCDKCPFHTLYRRTLIVHKNNHIGEKPFNDNMGVKYPSIDSKERPFQSTIRKCYFPIKSYVTNHMKFHFPRSKSFP